MIYKFFPYDELRPVQSEMISDVKNSVKTRQNLIVHAPTGLGKTVASLVPTLEYAEKYDKVVLFVTSRSSQHKMAIKTFNDILKKIEEDKTEMKREIKSDRKLFAVDLVGRQSMCVAEGVSLLAGPTFAEYCRESREKRTCIHFNRAFGPEGGLTFESKALMEKLMRHKPLFVEDFCNSCEGLCPYEMASMAIKQSRLIVADYYHIFDPGIKSMILKRIDKPLQDIILIVDEAHNLPKRVINLMSSKLHSIVVERAIKEAEKEGYEDIIPKIQIIQNVLNELSERLPSKSKIGDAAFDQAPVRKEDFTDSLNFDLADLSKGLKIENLIKEFSVIGDSIREKKKNSYIGSIANFLFKWEGEDQGHIRYIENENDKLVLIYRGIDPSYITEDVVNGTHCTILMSGTLLPTEMYKDMLGISNCIEKEYESPFPTENKSMFVVPKTTTLFKRRTEEEYKKIATICANITKEIKGNCAIFFPSYGILKSVSTYFSKMSSNKIFIESGDMTKKGKEGLLADFKANAIGHDMQRSLNNFTENNKSVLLGVLSGSFSEGVDYPKNMIKGVIVVGVPLGKPDIVIKSTMRYYDVKFNKGYEYAYLFPAMNKVMQATGRGIRSEKDVGVVVFLDERYVMDDYLAYLPRTVKIDADKYLENIKKFFDDLEN